MKIEQYEDLLATFVMVCQEYEKAQDELERLRDRQHFVNQQEIRINRLKLGL